MGAARPFKAGMIRRRDPVGSRRRFLKHQVKIETPSTTPRSAKIKRSMKMPKMILAMPADAPDIPVNPSNPAMTEITAKMMASFNIALLLGGPERVSPVTGNDQVRSEL